MPVPACQKAVARFVPTRSTGPPQWGERRTMRSRQVVVCSGYIRTSAWGCSSRIHWLVHSYSRILTKSHSISSYEDMDTLLFCPGRQYGGNHVGMRIFSARYPLADNGGRQPQSRLPASHDGCDSLYDQRRCGGFAPDADVTRTKGQCALPD